MNRLLSALGNLGEGHGREIRPEDITDEPGAIRVVEESIGAQLDIFTQLAGGLTYEDLVAEAESAGFRDTAFPYASKAQLIRIKEGSQREKDQLDVMAMRRLIEDPNAFD